MKTEKSYRELLKKMEDVRIGEGELEIMKSLWEESPRTLPEIVQSVRQSNAWEPVTIKTMLGRLLRKGAVEQSGNRRNYQYTPLIDRESYLEQTGRFLTEKFFNGAAGSMLSFFVRSGKLSESDLAELKKEIEELGR